MALIGGWKRVPDGVPCGPAAPTIHQASSRVPREKDLAQKKRRARDSNPQGPRGPVDFKSTALPVRTSPPNVISSTYGAGLDRDRWGVVKIAGTFSVTVTRDLHRRPFMAWGEMGIAQGHCNMSVAHEVLHRGQIDASYHQSRRKRMS